MAQESISFESPAGAVEGAVADVVRPTAAGNAIRAIVCVVGGLLGAAIFILIPIVHLVTTWLLPLLGVMLALRALRRKAAVYDAEGACPSCKEAIRLPGGELDDPSWQMCLRCGQRIQVRLGVRLG